MAADGALPVLLVRAGGRLCALPLGNVVETSRPLPVELVAGAPTFVRGLAIARGVPTPVLDLAALLGVAAPTGGHFVTVRVDGGRRILLAVSDVVAIEHLRREALAELPPLLGPGPAELASAVAALDRELVLVLAASRLLPEKAWAVLRTATVQA